jgi:Flp pilus assembly protein TadD
MLLNQPFAAEQKDLLLLLGYLYLRTGKPEQSAILFDVLHALDPADAHAAQSLACACLRSGRAEEAVQVLGSLVEQGNDAPLTHLLRGQALAQTGRLAEAARAMRIYTQAHMRPPTATAL